MHNRDPESEDMMELSFADVSIESLGIHLLYGDVDTESMKAASAFIIKANMVNQTDDELTIFVNTVGGNCYDGFALIDLMSISRLPIRTVGLGSIVSMGVLIACAGTKGRRVMTRNSEVMAHQFAGSTHGKFHELVAATKANMYLEHQFVQHFLRHSSMNEKQIRDVMFGPSDRWLSPAECKKFGLIDSVIDQLPDINERKPRAPSRRETPVPQSKPRARKPSVGTD